MFIYNLKLNKNTSKIIFIIITIIIAIISIFTIFKLFSESFKVKDKINPEINVLTVQNYTNVLKAVHDNLPDYIGKKLKFSGYIYRLEDFKDNHFVLARDMLISSNMKSLIVGFLCEYNNIKDYPNNTWVEITGKIGKANYHGEIPIIQIEEIKKIQKPTESIYVFPPDDAYIPTSAMF